MSDHAEKKRKRKNAPGAGRPAKNYVPMHIYLPPEIAEKIRAERGAGETLGEVIAKRFR